jgi:hypothetical protein
MNIREAAGAIEIDRTGSGVIRALSASTPDFTLRADAAWTTRHPDDLAIRSEFTLSGRRLTADLRSILPDELRTILDDLSFELAGPFALEDGRLSLNRGTNGRTSAIDFTGAMRFRDAAIDIGFPLSQITGRIDTRLSRSAPEDPPTFSLDIRADSLSAAGISMNDALASVRSGQRPGEIYIQRATADAHDGRINASAIIAPPESPLAPYANVPIFGPPAPDRRAFTADLQLAGVRFSPLLNQFLRAQSSSPAASALLEHDDYGQLLEGVGVALPDSPEAGDLSRGELDGQLSISGIVGDPRSRRGRGSLRIAGGRVINLPIVLALLEVSNFTLPVNASLDYAASSFFLDGGLIVFDDLSVHSSALHIFGSGTMTWPDMLLDLRFDSRAARPVPVLSQLLSGIRSELVTTTIRGRLGEHEVRLQQLPRPRRILREAVRQLPMPSQEADEIQRQSQDGRQRGGDFGPGIAPTRASTPRGAAARQN